MVVIPQQLRIVKTVLRKQIEYFEGIVKAREDGVVTRSIGSIDGVPPAAACPCAAAIPDLWPQLLSPCGDTPAKEVIQNEVSRIAVKRKQGEQAVTKLDE